MTNACRESRHVFIPFEPAQPLRTGMIDDTQLLQRLVEGGDAASGNDFSEIDRAVVSERIS